MRTLCLDPAPSELGRAVRLARPRTADPAALERHLPMLRDLLRSDAGVNEVVDAWTLGQERGRRIKARIFDLLCDGSWPRLPPSAACVDAVYEATFSLGSLEALLDQQSVTDVFANGWSQVFYVTDRGERHSAPGFGSPDHYHTVFERIVRLGGAVLNQEDPVADFALPNGIRVNACIPPITPRPALSLRILRQGRFTLKDLADRGMLDEQLAAYLAEAVASGTSGVIGGEVGSGKTTLLNALLQEAAGDRRIITAEDTPELSFEGLHWVPYFTRPPTVKGGSREYDLHFVVKDILRKRPDIVVIGEVRGPEALPMLLSLAAGTCGWTSCHGVDANAVLARLETLALLGMGPGGSWMAARRLVAEAVRLVVMVGICRDGVRRLASIHEVLQPTRGGFRLRQVARLKELEPAGPGRARRHVHATQGNGALHAR